MQNKNYLTVVTVIFALITVVHGLRIISGWSTEIGGWTVPMWVSWLAVLVAGYLAYTGFKMMKKAN